MHLVVPARDEFAVGFVTRVLDAAYTESDGKTSTFWLTGGGCLPVFVSSENGHELGKGPYSCRKLAEQNGIRGGGTCVQVVLNPTSTKLHQQVRGLLGQMRQDSKDWVAPKHLRGRGGAVLFEELAYTGRIVRSCSIAPSGLPANQFFTEASGFAEPVVTYGTSDAANVFELLEALKAGWQLGMPVVFDQYESAHTAGDYWNRVGCPSFTLLDSGSWEVELWFDREGAFTQPIDSEKLLWALRVCGWHTIPTTYVESIGKTLAQWYRRGMELVAEQVLELLELSVPLKVVTMEALFAQTPFWQQPVSMYGWELGRRAGHEVGVVNTSDEGRLMTRDHLPSISLGDIHQQGWWLAGYPVYHLGYSLGAGGGVVQLVKDGSKGEVHRLAKPYLEDPASGLYLMPVGLFRLHAVGQDENASVDPWVFLELLHRWGNRAREYVRQIWDLMEVPLVPCNVGRETRVAVGLDGLAVRVRES